MNTWHYMLNGAQAGPVTTDELNGLFTAGTLKGDTLVWRQGMAAWTPANQVPELSTAAATATTPVRVDVPLVTATPAAPLSESADVEKNKIFGVISYLGLLFLVPLIAARESKFAMYHCNQGAVLTITWFVAIIGSIVLGHILGFIPFLGFFLSMLISLVLWVGFFALAIIGIINAINGRCKPLPIIGNLFTLIK